MECVDCTEQEGSGCVSLVKSPCVAHSSSLGAHVQDTVEVANNAILEAGILYRRPVRFSPAE